MKKNPVEIQILRGTTSQWNSFDDDENNSSSLRLLEGEFGYDTATKKLRVGDGFTKFSELPFVTLVNKELLTEMGEWTPEISSVQNSTYITNSSSQGTYYKIGNFVQCWFSCTITISGRVAYCFINTPFSFDSTIFTGESRVGSWNTTATTGEGYIPFSLDYDGELQVLFFKRYDNSTGKSVYTSNNMAGTSLPSTATITGTFSYLIAEE